MAKCSGCNAELPVDALFCPKCATRVTAQPVAPVATVSPVVATMHTGVAAASGLDTLSGTKTTFVAP